MLKGSATDVRAVSDGDSLDDHCYSRGLLVLVPSQLRSREDGGEAVTDWPQVIVDQAARRRVLRSMALRQAEAYIQRWYRQRTAHLYGCPPLAPLVYALADPRNGEVFYIGKGIGRWRVVGHEWDARSGKTTPKCRRIRAILAAGLHPEVRTIALCQPHDAHRIERELINEMADVLTNDCGEDGIL